jgi:tetratricopeptide (TPR) repeat protein
MNLPARLISELAFFRHLLVAHRSDEAQAALAALEGPDAVLAPAWLALGESYFQAERYAEAIRVLEKALAMGADPARTHQALGQARFNRGEVPAAQADFEAVLALDPQHGPAHRSLAALAINRDDFERALDHLRQAVAANPKDAESWSLIATVHYRRFDGANFYRQWTRQNLTHPQARPDLLTPAGKPASLDEALAALAKVRALDARVRADEIGFRLLVAAGRPEDALAHLAADPAPDATTLRLLADGSFLLGDHESARRWHQESLLARCQGPIAPRPLGSPAPKAVPRLGVPIVYVHWGAPDHLALSIAQAQRAAPDSPVVVIGDRWNRYRGVEHALIRDHLAAAEVFARRYVHRSENDFSYELFCFQRWFILADWARANGVEILLALDSDVLLFERAGKLAQRLNGRAAGFAGPLGPQLAALTQEGLDALCAHYDAFYRAEAWRGARAQISDMTLLPDFFARLPAADLNADPGLAFIDGNIRLAEGFVLQDGMKALVFENGRPIGVDAAGQPRPFAALHFQGVAKRKMAALAQAARESISS